MNEQVTEHPGLPAPDSSGDRNLKRLERAGIRQAEIVERAVLVGPGRRVEVETAVSLRADGRSRSSSVHRRIQVACHYAVHPSAGDSPASGLVKPAAATAECATKLCRYPGPNAPREISAVERRRHAL